MVSNRKNKNNYIQSIDIINIVIYIFLFYQTDDKKPKPVKKIVENDLDDLKRELEIVIFIFLISYKTNIYLSIHQDDHKIPVEELYRRYETHPEKVNISNYFIYFK